MDTWRKVTAVFFIALLQHSLAGRGQFKRSLAWENVAAHQNTEQASEKKARILEINEVPLQQRAGSIPLSHSPNNT